jgi:hypothetical protein
MMDDDMYKERESKYVQGSYKALQDEDWWCKLNLSPARYPNDHFRNWLQTQREAGEPTMLHVVTFKAHAILGEWEQLLQRQNAGGFAEEWDGLMQHIANRYSHVTYTNN